MQELDAEDRKSIQTAEEVLRKHFAREYGGRAFNHISTVDNDEKVVGLASLGPAGISRRLFAADGIGD